MRRPLAPRPGDSLSVLRHIAKAAMIVIAGWLAGCSSADPGLTAALIGKWGEVRQFDGQVIDQVIELKQDGSFVVTGNKTERGTTMKFVLRGAWRVQDGHFRYKALSSEPPDFFPPGEELKDRIVSVSDREWVMIEQNTGQESRAWKYSQ